MPDPTPPAADAPGNGAAAPEENQEFTDAFAQYARGDNAAPGDPAPGDGDPDARATPADDPAPEPEPEPGARADDPAPGEPAPEPDDDRARWASMSDDDRFSAWKSSKTRLRKEVSGLATKNRELERLVEELRTAAPPAPAAPAPAQPTAQQVTDAIAGDDETWAAFQAEYPEVAAAIDARASAVEARLQGRLEEQGQTITRQVDERIAPVLSEREQAAVDEQKAAIAAAHADWAQVVVSDDYAAWLATQTPGVQQLANSAFADDLALVLDRFKSSESYDGPRPGADDPANDPPSEVARIRQERDRRLDASVTVPTSSRTTVRPAGSDDFSAAFKGYAQAEDQKRQQQLAR